MTLDNINFETCTKLETEANCVKGCQWYKGTGVVTTPIVNPANPTLPVVDPNTPTTQPTGSCNNIDIGTAAADTTTGIANTMICFNFKTAAACQSTCVW